MVHEVGYQIVAELRQAIENDQLVLFYQPKATFADGVLRLTGTE